MARPARVRMRARKPWVRLRRRLLGWKVRLLTWDYSLLFEELTAAQVGHGEVAAENSDWSTIRGKHRRNKTGVSETGELSKLHECSPVDTPIEYANPLALAPNHH